jgi:hypothetical protein
VGGQFEEWWASWIEWRSQGRAGAERRGATWTKAEEEVWRLIVGSSPTEIALSGWIGRV